MAAGCDRWSPSRASPRSLATRPHLSHPIELWRLHGATDDLRGLAMTTSFGIAFGLELDTELILLHLLPNDDRLEDYAQWMLTVLLAQGWRLVDPRRPERVMQ